MASEPLEVEDIFEVFTVPVETSEGTKLVTKHNFSPVRAAKSVIKKFGLKMTGGDEKTIWRFDGKIYRPDGKPYLKNCIYTFAANNIEKKDMGEVLDRIISELLLSPVVFNPHPHLRASI